MQHLILPLIFKKKETNFISLQCQYYARKYYVQIHKFKIDDSGEEWHPIQLKQF